MAKQLLRPHLFKPASLTLLTSATAFLLLLFASFCCSAQTDQGAITGVVQDPTGAVIPNA
jgi:hypothetical protein